MPRYNVTMPLAGSITFYGVEADNEKAAVEAARLVDVNVKFESAEDEPVYTELNDIEWLESMGSGNVNYYSLNDAYVELDDSDEEDAG